MIEETGTVLSVEEGYAEVETIRTSSCTSCRARHGCGHHAIAQVSASNRMRMRATAPFEVEVGQRVVVGIPEDTLLQASFWMYLMPLLGLVGGAMIPSLWQASNDVSVICSIMGFVFGLLLAKRKSLSEINNPNFYPTVLRIERPLQDEHIPLIFTP
ncbi:SoxR reducing system RseC family protein [Marinomonas spartinae]|uniref:SoxR reducing system RseC family protein n=1 Tax=Marinomonas spartinae TaxID=1792290 RepID=UPI0018F25ADF|nr:SoxR reducing system RseC family protein [Marinomonas spartinae]MBJ7556120.1 SoxR reducing system RseC family protein [Marinomonas spartinae]